MTDKTSTSIQLSELTLEQLVQISQGLGRQADAIRAQRAYLAAKIAERVAKGERTCTDPTMAPADAETISPADVAVIDASAAGAVIEASARA